MVLLKQHHHVSYRVPYILKLGLEMRNTQLQGQRAWHGAILVVTKVSKDNGLKITELLVQLLLHGVEYVCWLAIRF